MGLGGWAGRCSKASCQRQGRDETHHAISVSKFESKTVLTLRSKPGTRGLQEWGSVQWKATGEELKWRSGGSSARAKNRGCSGQPRGPLGAGITFRAASRFPLA